MMRWFYKLPLRFRSLFRKSHVERELSEELRFHLERLIEEKVARASPRRKLVTQPRVSWVGLNRSRRSAATRAG